MRLLVRLANFPLLFDRSNESVERRYIGDVANHSSKS